MLFPATSTTYAMLCLEPTSNSSMSGSDQLDLVIFYFGSIFCLNQLAAVYAGTVKLNLHITTADDFTSNADANATGISSW